MTKKTVLFSIIVCLMCSLGQAQAQKEYIHPYNKILAKLYPRPFKLRWPGVPRILPSEAFSLYKANRALFIRIGVEGGIVPGALYGKYIQNTDPRKLYKYAKRRMIIVY